MAIMGGALLPKLMGLGDKIDMSRGFIVPLVCFAFVAFYGFGWSRFSGTASMTGKSSHTGSVNRDSHSDL